MKKIIWLLLGLLVAHIGSGQVVLGLKGTRVTIDSSKWKLSGNNIYNKNFGNLGIGTASPTAQLHTTGTIRFEGIGTNTGNTKILTTDASGNLTTRVFSNLLSGELASLSTGILKSTTGTGALSIATAGDFPVLNQNTTGNAATVTTNANLTGPVQSVGNATSISTNVITNSMLAQTASSIFKGRATAGTGNVEDLSSSQATALLNTFTSTDKGLVPASGGGTTTFLRADGSFAAPSSGSRNLVVTTADQISSNTSNDVLENVTGLSFSVVAGTLYRFYILIPYNSSSTNNGSRWTISCPTTTLLNYVSRYPITATTETLNYLSVQNFPLASNSTSLATGNMAILEGLIKPSANGTVQVRFASELPNSSNTITIKAGATLEWW